MDRQARRTGSLLALSSRHSSSIIVVVPVQVVGHVAPAPVSDDAPTSTVTIAGNCLRSGRQTLGPSVVQVVLGFVRISPSRAFSSPNHVFSLSHARGYWLRLFFSHERLDKQWLRIS